MSTKQSRITAKGDVAAGNILKSVTFSKGGDPTTLLKKLYAQYEKDVATGNTTNEVLESLKEYIPDEQDLEALEKDLEIKLTAAGRQDLVEEARRYKERFRQRLERYILYPAAQAIYAYLLGHVLTRFNSMVKPAIEEGYSVQQVSALVQEQVVEEIIRSIPETEPICDHPALYGMIYFLTGNCYIDW